MKWLVVKDSTAVAATAASDAPASTIRPPSLSLQSFLAHRIRKWLKQGHSTLKETRRLQMFRASMANVRYSCGHSQSIHTLHNGFCDLLDRPTPPLYTHTHHITAQQLTMYQKKCSTSWSYYYIYMLKLLHTSGTSNVKQAAFSICTTSLKSKLGQIHWCQTFSQCNVTWTVLLEIQIY